MSKIIKDDKSLSAETQLQLTNETKTFIRDRIISIKQAEVTKLSLELEYTTLSKTFCTNALESIMQRLNNNYIDDIPNQNALPKTNTMIAISELIQSKATTQVFASIINNAYLMPEDNFEDIKVKKFQINFYLFENQNNKPCFGTFTYFEPLFSLLGTNGDSCEETTKTRKDNTTGKTTAPAISIDFGKGRSF